MAICDQKRRPFGLAANANRDRAVSSVMKLYVAVPK